MMISVPAKPPSTSDQRSAETFSPSAVAASSVISSGTMAPMAVNSATGMYLRLRKANRLLSSSSRPRRHWNFGWAVRSTLRPRSGSTTAVVATAWKK